LDSHRSRGRESQQLGKTKVKEQDPRAGRIPFAFGDVEMVLIVAVEGIGIYVLMKCLVWVGCVFVFKIAVGPSAVVSAIAAIL
jgi:hypothetical protein